MRRWSFLVLTLHFILSLGLFAHGQIQGAGLSDASVQVTAAGRPSLMRPAQCGDLLGNSHDHQLSDEQAELPEFLPQAVPAPVLRPHSGGPSGPSLVHLTPPPLDGPQRPPRQVADVT